MRTLLATALCALALAVHAEEAKEPPQLGELEVITVIASKTPRTLREVAGTATVIDAQRLQETLALDLREALRYEPGVSALNDPARFGLRGFNIRGMEGNRVAIEIDGVPAPQAFALGSFAGAGRGYVDPEVLKRIDILRGPASTLYGSDALGGVVTYTTKDPADYLGAAPAAVSLRTGYHGQDASAFATLAMARTAGPVDALLVYSRRDGHETENDAPGTKIDANPEDHVGASWIGKLVHAGARSTLRLTADVGADASAVDVRSAIGGPGKFATTTSLLADDVYERMRLSVDEQRLLERAWADSLNWRAYHQRSETDQRTDQTRSPDASTPYPTRRMRDFQYDRTVDGLELGLARELGGPRAQHRLLYGLDLAQTSITELRDGVETDLEKGSTTSVILGEDLPVRDFPRTRVREMAAYVQDEIMSAGLWTLIPGIRFEHYQLEPQADAVFAQDNPDTPALSVRERSYSPKLGALRQLGTRWTAFGQYARGFRSPPVEDVNLGFTIPAFNYIALPNPDLKPETSDGIELGAHYSGPALALSVVGYYNRYENLIESRVNLGPDPVTGALVFQSQNRARATLYGMEYRGALTLGALERWRLRSSVAFGIGNDDERDEPLNSVDPARLVLGLAYGSASAPWRVELVGTLVADKHRVDRTAAPLFQPAGYGVLDLYVHRAVSARASLDLGVFNLSNERYWTWSDVRGVLVDDPLLDLYTRPGFNAALSLNYRM